MLLLLHVKAELFNCMLFDSDEILQKENIMAINYCSRVVYWHVFVDAVHYLLCIVFVSLWTRSRRIERDILHMVYKCKVTGCLALVEPKTG